MVFNATFKNISVISLR